nr:hypothetical protein Iba_chr05eCG8370 [Ipomoea batatas]
MHLFPFYKFLSSFHYFLCTNPPITLSSFFIRVLCFFSCELLRDSGRPKTKRKMTNQNVVVSDPKPLPGAGAGCFIAIPRPLERRKPTFLIMGKNSLSLQVGRE